MTITERYPPMTTVQEKTGLSGQLTGIIQNEHTLTTTDSLVLIRLNDAQNNFSYVVTIVSHPSEKPVTYRNSEIVPDDRIVKVFSSRALFGGRNSETLRNYENEVSIGPTDIRLV